MHRHEQPGILAKGARRCTASLHRLHAPAARQGVCMYIRWRMLTYADICWRMLTCVVCTRLLLDKVRMLTYAHVCGRMLTYADVCWRKRCSRWWTRRSGALSSFAERWRRRITVPPLPLLLARRGSFFFVNSTNSRNRFTGTISISALLPVRSKAWHLEWEGGRERERGTDRQTDRETDRESGPRHDIYRERETATATATERREREREQ